MPHFLLAIAILCVSAAAPLYRLAEPLPPLWVAALRIALAAIVLSMLSGRNISTLWRTSRGSVARIALAGALLAAHFASWITSLSLTSTAASMALVATTPIFVAVIGFVSLGEGPGRRQIVGIAIAAAGCAITAYGDALTAPTAALGDLLAVTGAATAAGYLVVGRRARAEIDLLPYLAGTNLVAGMLLVGAAAIAAPPLAGYSGTDYAAVALMAVVCSVGGHTLLNAAVRRVPVHLVGLAILAEPILSSAGTWIAFGERPPASAALGGGVILVGLWAGFSGPRRA